ncbi:MAG TPA: Tat pathway signal sequence domain protein [Opitutaceae bacterium]
MSLNKVRSGDLNRREFVKTAALTAAALPFAAATRAAGAGQGSPAARGAAAPVRWLDGAPPVAFPGATWGMPWPRETYAKDTSFSLLSAAGAAVPVQSWPIAYWPDGTLKWTAHAVPADVPLAAGYELVPGPAVAPSRALTAVESSDSIQIETGVITARIARRGEVLVPELVRGGTAIARDGRLVCLLEDRSEPGVKREQAFAGRIDAVTLEQAGPVRAVVRVEGRHANDQRAWLPFIVRLYFYAGGESVRVMHTIVFDGNKDQDFVTGLGLRFTVPLQGELHDRHVRFAGSDDGLFGEAIRGLTGLRRAPDRTIREAQVAGRATPPLGEWDRNVASRLSYIPAYDDWTLAQTSVDGFQIKKRTGAGYTWLMAAQGHRAGGLGFLGTPGGGLGFGIRNFWQSHPAQLDIRGATKAEAEVTIWLWAPDAPAMDLRSYHDGLGQDTYEKQYNGGLEITYEDYEPGFDTPEGVARTSELHLWVVGATPPRERLVELAEALRNPPVITTTPEQLHACGVFGDIWAPRDWSTPARKAIEDKLDWCFNYYREQQEQRRWYGYWNYGDVMHTYDADRHEWRYDVGGFAWDNSELSTDIWLWQHYLRSGRADVFRFAEAMTRHTGEVDVHHIGRFAPLGSRHNVLHWGCSAKQLRISTAINRRFYYYLTADERVGDLMREQIEGGRALLRVPPGRKLATAEIPGDLDRGATTGFEQVGLSVGTDWGSLAGAWLTEWERTGDSRMRDRLLAGMRTIGRQPRGFFSVGVTMNLDTGAFNIVDHERVGVSHLNAVFGLVEICAELNQLLDVPEFRRAWLDYCTLYSAPAAEQERVLGQSFSNNTLRQGYSRLTAYAAHAAGDPALAARAWEEFFERAGRMPTSGIPEKRRVSGPDVLRPVDEAVQVSTNGTAQWGLAAMQCLALVGEYLDGRAR